MSLKFLTVQIAVIQAAVSKPDRIITATDVFDVVAQQCHEGNVRITAHLVDNKNKDDLFDRAHLCCSTLALK